MIRPSDDFAAAPPPPAAGAPAPDPIWNLPAELEYFRTSEAYRVELDGFQGPLDLLLYLIQKDEIDIYDIPIASITDQFLRYLEVIKLLDLDNAGDFLVMAATLVRIKTRMLLPVPAEEEPGEEDPRAELVRRLLEYKRYKEAAAQFRRLEAERSLWATRRSPYPFLTEAERSPPELRFSLYELLAALAEVVDRLEGPRVHTVRRTPFTVEQKLVQIVERLQAGAPVRFQDLFAEDAIRMEVVVTFIAILELARRGRLRFFQTEANGPIWLHASSGAQPAAPLAAAAAAGEAAGA